MENKLEQLLNSLIEKGWRIENPKARISDVKYMYGLRELRIVYETDRRDAVRAYPIRFLVSKESNLWQFVCENKLLAKGILDLPDVLWKRDSLACMRTDLRKSCYPHDYEYRLIEASLKDESELEDFLLSNIKVDVESK